MNRKKNLIVLIIGLLFLGASFWGTNSSKAQQTTTTSPTAVPTPPDLPIEDEEIIKIDSEVVNVLFTAQDRKRRLLTTLQQGDIKLFENGQEQEIVAFSRKIDLPLSLTILIDTSRSQERTLPEEKDAARSFVESVVRPTKDEVAIISFTGETTLEQGMTSNLSRLRRAIDRVQYIPPVGTIGGGVVVGTPPLSGGNQAVAASTAIWDAIWITSNEILGESPEGTRRAMILLSDGVDNYSRKKINEAISEAQKAETVIYSIGIGDNYYQGTNSGLYQGVDTRSLKKLSEQTGGRAFFPRDERELRLAFDQIQEEMRSQYLIAYEPLDQKRDGSYRTIDIKLINQQLSKEKVLLTHREGYFAKTEKK